MATERLIEAEKQENPALLAESVAVSPSPPITLLEDINNIIFKLRAFVDADTTDVGFGVELGMQRAADMIENVISRYARDGE